MLDPVDHTVDTNKGTDMTLTLTRSVDTQAATSMRPSAVALRASVAAVRDALAHMDDDAVLSVPTGTPHENFEIVEWCAHHDKPVINRFDPWPLDHLMIQNRVRHTTVRTRTSESSSTTAINDFAAPGGVGADAPTTGRRRRMRRHPLRALRRGVGRDDRPPGLPSHSTPLAQAAALRGAGPF